MTTPVVHAYGGSGLWCTASVRLGDNTVPCGYARTEEVHYLDRADLYRAACAPRELPATFARSMRWWLIVDSTDTYQPDSRDPSQVFTDPFTTALRAAIGQAQDWADVAKASHELEQDVHRPDDTLEERTRASYCMGQNHQALYCAHNLLRTIAQELYRQHVPAEERVL